MSEQKEREAFERWCNAQPDGRMQPWDVWRAAQAAAIAQGHACVFALDNAGGLYRRYSSPQCSLAASAAVQAVPTQHLQEQELFDQFIAALRAYADNEYCQGIRMAGWHGPCLGWESKIKTGKFGRVEHEAHEKMNKHFGAHYGIYEAIKRALAEVRPALPATPTEPVQRPGDHLPGGQQA